MDDQLVLLYDGWVQKQYYYKVLSSNLLIRLKPNPEDIDQLLVEPYTVQSSADVCSDKQSSLDLISLMTVRLFFMLDNQTVRRALSKPNQFATTQFLKYLMLWIKL